MSDAPTLRTGGQILVDNLVEQGCDRIFCVPGESYLAVLDALHDTDAIDLVVCRQEGGVSFMAAADGAMTGHPGIAFVTRGPGATNGSIGGPCRDAGFGSDDLFHWRCRARRHGSRSVSGDRLSRNVRPDVQMGGRRSTRRSGSPNILRGPYSVADERSARAGQCSRCPKTCCADTVTAPDRPKVIRPAQHPDPEAMAGDDGTSQGRRIASGPLLAAQTGARARRIISRASPKISVFSGGLWFPSPGRDSE